jgi:acyl-CoA thioesterase
MGASERSHDVDQSLESRCRRLRHGGRYGTIRLVSDQERPQVSFIAFLFSLASNAAVHFGDLPDPMTNETRPPDLEAASQLIEIIAMLEEKTRGNLTAEERQLLDQVLFELRMRFVEASKSQSPIIQP